MLTHVKKATIGISTLLLKKSKNVKKSIPKTRILLHKPLPNDDGIPSNKQIPITIRPDLNLLKWNLSIMEDTIASIIEIELVNAAKNTSTKNNKKMFATIVNMTIFQKKLNFKN